MITKGAVFRAEYRVYDGTGTLTNPTTATLALTKPDGTLVTPAPTISLPPAQTGILVYDYTTTVAGLHRGLWATTTPTTSKPFTFNVGDSTSGGILSLADARAHLNVEDDDTASDDEILTFLDVVTIIVESRCGAVLPKTYVERHDACARIMLRHGPPTAIVSVTTWLASQGETVDAADMMLDPVTWAIERVSGIGFPWGPYRVEFTASRPVVPANILHGARELLAHLWRTQRGPSLVGTSPGALGEDELFAVAGRAYSVPRAVLELLGPSEIGPLVG